MALTPISGEIISQALNDNFSYLDNNINTHKADMALVKINVLYPPVPMVGAKGDGKYLSAGGTWYTDEAMTILATDDTTAIQNIIDYCQTNNRTCYFPKNIYTVTSINLNDQEITIEGEHFMHSIVWGTTPTNAIFNFLDIAQNTRFHFKNIGIDGGSLADYGVYSTKIDHATFERVRISQTNISALSTGGGWSVDILNCEFSFNNGNGFTTNNFSNNIVNIKDTKIFRNEGLGIHFTSGHLLNIDGCTIETNKKGGMCVSTGVKGININGNYFEANAEIGNTFTTPSLNVKADIIINGAATAVSLTNFAAAYPCNAIKIEGNTFDDGYAEQAIYLIAGNDLSIKNNAQGSGPSVPLITLYGDRSVSLVSNMEVIGNNGFSKDINITNIINYRMMALSTIGIDNEQKTNYAPDSIFNYSLQVAGDSGVISKGDIKYNGFETMVITGADTLNPNFYGFDIVLDDYLELQGEAVYFGAWVKQSAIDMNANIFINTGTVGLISTLSSTVTSDTNWRWVEYQANLESTGTATFAFAKKGAGNLYIANPILSVVGSNKSLFYKNVKKPEWFSSAVPTAGSWNVGDTVYNTTPIAGGYIGWVCITAGTPGTFKTFGAITA